MASLIHVRRIGSSGTHYRNYIIIYSCNILCVYEGILYQFIYTVLNSVRRNSDDFRSSTTTAGRRHDDVVFPRMNSMPDFITTENVPASVTVPGALLDQHYEGQFRRSLLVNYVHGNISITLVTVGT